MLVRARDGRVIFYLDDLVAFGVVVPFDGLVKQITFGFFGIVRDFGLFGHGRLVLSAGRRAVVGGAGIVACGKCAHGKR